MPMDDPPVADKIPASDPSGRYYRLDRRGMTYAEGWRLLPSWKVVYLWQAKWSGVSSPLIDGCMVPRGPREGWVARQDLPPAATGALDAVQRACEPFGFGEPVYLQPPQDLRSLEMAICLLRQPSGETVAGVICVQSAGAGSPVKPTLEFSSEFPNGTTIVTTDGRFVFDHPPGLDNEHLPSLDAAALYRRHVLRLAGCQAAGQLPVPVRTTEELAAVVWRNERRHYDFKLAKGLYVLMTPAEVASLRARRAIGQRLIAVGHSPRTVREVEAVLAALDRRDQPAAASSVAAWTWLIVSLAAFVAVGIWQWDRTFVALIVGALLLHESGHYVAMRAFGYRHLRMFFLPFFGAAVSGRNPRAASWQKALVSLAGPLPGLLLGTSLWLSGRRHGADNSLGWEIALVLVGLNAFNLLPFLPLDGGRVLYETLFVRSASLRTTFSTLAGGGVLALAYQSGSPILGFLGLFLLMLVGRMRRFNRAVRELHAGGVMVLESTSVPGQERAVRPDALPALLDSLKRGREKPLAGNVLVSEALAVIDLARARPPGVAATVGLLALYAAACALSLYFLWPLLGQRHPGRTRHHPVRPLSHASPSVR